MSKSWPRAANRVVAVVDDDLSVRIGMANLMQAIGLSAEMFESANAFLRNDMARFSCVLSDMQMPGMSGLDLQRELARTAPTLPIIFMTGYPDESVRDAAMTAGAQGIFEKPCDIEELVAVVEEVHL